MSFAQNDYLFSQEYHSLNSVFLNGNFSCKLEQDSGSMLQTGADVRAKARTAHGACYDEFMRDVFEPALDVGEELVAQLASCLKT